MSRCRALLVLFGLICTPTLAALPTPVDAAQGDLQLIAQNFNIAADGSLTATIALPASLAAAPAHHQLNNALMEREIGGPALEASLSHPTWMPPECW